jgi:hypothetical protein
LLKSIRKPPQDVADHVGQGDWSMLKVLVLVCAASASGFGIHMSGWFTSQPAPTQEVRSSDPLQSDEAMRYRHNQSNQWRMIMSIR